MSISTVQLLWRIWKTHVAGDTQSTGATQRTLSDTCTGCPLRGKSKNRKPLSDQLKASEALRPDRGRRWPRRAPAPFQVSSRDNCVETRQCISTKPGARYLWVENSLTDYGWSAWRTSHSVGTLLQPIPERAVTSKCPKANRPVKRACPPSHSHSIALDGTNQPPSPKWYGAETEKQVIFQVISPRDLYNR